MSGMSGGSMLRTRRKDVNIKPNRRLDRKSSRGMLYENEELRLRTININAEVERGQCDIKKLKRENEQLRREVGALRGEYDRLERLLKARHPEELSDQEESNSCCSECESECCNAQNELAEESPPCCRSSEAGCEDARRRGPRSEGLGCGSGKHENGLGSCEVLPSLPEEPLLRVPSVEAKDEHSFNFPQDQSDVTLANRVFPEREYYTAVVTMPLASQVQECEGMTGPTVFPKAGLDILINNNAYDNFQGYRSSPHIGFVMPPPPLDFNLEGGIDNQIVPNILADSGNMIGFNGSPGDVGFDGGRNVNDFLKCVNLDCVKDSYFICNTKKIIQQLTVHNTNNVPDGEVFQQEDASLTSPDSNGAEIPDDDGLVPRYKTEKSIELNYDYPGTCDRFEGAGPQERVPDGRDGEISQSLQTTTEIKSMFVLFGRKNGQAKKKGLPFIRSFSAPVENSKDEPVYATVKKLPKKFKHLHIKNLENETKYIPNEEAKDDKAGKRGTLTGILKTSEPNTPENEVRISDGLPKNESDTERVGVSQTPNVIPKSPMVTKKKRFSIHFKRKNSKKTNAQAADSSAPTEVKEITPEEKVQPDNFRESSERLLEMSSSWESQDMEPLRSKDGCRKHKHARHACPRAKCRCEKCTSTRKKECDHHVKRRYSPARSYLKNDSYQEMTSHSERERTNSLSSSAHSGFSINAKSAKMSVAHREGSIPWCGCWGNSCL